MLYNVVIKYHYNEHPDVILTLTYSSCDRSDCEYRAIRYIASAPAIKVISITFKEE